MRIVVLGCGFHGRGVAYQLAASGAGEVVVADLDPARAAATGAKAGTEWAAVDVRDREALGRLLAGAGVVFNATGPYHLLALGVIEAAIEQRVQYVDMLDDHEVAEATLLDPSWDQRAKAAGVAVILGCGIMPGLGALLTRYAYDRIEAPHTVDIRFVWNYNRAYPAAIQHFLRINSGLAPQWLDGRYERPGAFAGKLTAGFLPPVGPTPVYYTGVPDAVSIPHFLAGLRDVTARGAFYQPEANDFLEHMVRWGMASYADVPGESSRPMEYLLRFLASDAGAPYFEVPRADLPMAIQVSVAGPDAALTYEAHDHTRRATTAVAALVTEMVARGQIDRPGIGAPESAVPVDEVLRRVVAVPDIRIYDRSGSETRAFEG